MGDVQLTKDLSPIGKQPYRFWAFALDSGLTVGILADVFTRIDLIHKALVGSNLPQVLGVTGSPSGKRASVVEI